MGCMAFSHGYGAIPDERYSIEVIRGAYNAGCTFFDTAEVYGPNLAHSQRGHNERIVGKALAGVRDDVVIATKLFLDMGFGGTYKRIRRHLEASMDRLQTDYVDSTICIAWDRCRWRTLPRQWDASSTRGSLEDGASRRWMWIPSVERRK